MLSAIRRTALISAITLTIALNPIAALADNESETLRNEIETVKRELQRTMQFYEDQIGDLERRLAERSTAAPDAPQTSSSSQYKPAPAPVPSAKPTPQAPVATATVSTTGG